jgi:AP-1 complex subunit beta-1
MNKVCPAEKSGGVDVFAGFRQVNGKVVMELEFQNVSSDTPVSNLAIQLNKNAFGLSPASQQIVLDPPINNGYNGKSTVELITSPGMMTAVDAGQGASPQVQIAVKNMATSHIYYFAVNFNLEALFASDGAMDRTSFIDTWKNIDDTNELYSTLSELPATSLDIDQVRAKFGMYNIFFIARRAAMEGQEVVYFSMKTMTGMDFLAELTFKKGVNACKLCVKTENSAYGLIAKNSIENLLRF